MTSDYDPHVNRWGERLLDMPVQASEIITPLPDPVRVFIAKRVGKWPERGDINYPFPEALEAMADYLDMLGARVFGETLE
jgi:hypothetical protein